VAPWDGADAPYVFRFKDPEGQMNKIASLIMGLLVPVLMTACDDDDDVFGVNNDLVGDFQANDFGFTGTTDASLVRDFDGEGAALTMSLRNDGTFETRFTEQGANPVVRTGTFTAQGNEVSLGNRALMTGSQDNVQQRFIFERRNNNLILRSASDMRFDFNGDDIFSADEAARFDAELVPR
jgi:hypothetical protein